MSEWKLIDDNTPRDGRPLLVCRGDRVFIVRWWEDGQDSGWSLDVEGRDMVFLVPENRQPTHWQGRPAPVSLEEAVEQSRTERQYQGSHHRHFRKAGI